MQFSRTQQVAHSTELLYWELRSAACGNAAPMERTRGDDLLSEVGVGPLGPTLGRRVAIQVGQPVRFPSMTSLPLTWEPVGLEGLLPRLDANIEAGSLGEDRTQLAISARYRPPLGLVGRTVDRVLLHRVAEATLKDFLDRIGAAITSQAEAATAASATTTTEGGLHQDVP